MLKCIVAYHANNLKERGYLKDRPIICTDLGGLVVSRKWPVQISSEERIFFVMNVRIEEWVGGSAQIRMLFGFVNPYELLDDTLEDFSRRGSKGSEYSWKRVTHPHW